MFSCLLSRKTSDSNMTLIKDSIVSKQRINIYWAKESSSFLMNVLVNVLLFNTSLKTLGDLTCYAKG